MPVVTGDVVGMIAREAGSGSTALPELDETRLERLLARLLAGPLPEFDPGDVFAASNKEASVHVISADVEQLSRELNVQADQLLARLRRGRRAAARRI